MQTFSRTALLLLLFSLLSPRLFAQRIHWPMGIYVQRAAIVVLADTEPTGPGGYDTLLTFREVLKGDPDLAGHTFVSTLNGNSESIFLPKNSKGIAVLLSPGWDKPDPRGDYVEEAYTDPKDIALLRTFVDIYRLPTEQERFAALQTHLHDPNPVFQEQWLQDILSMREPTDYSFITASFPELDREEQIRLIGIIGQIGDLRGVPILIQAMSSPDRGVWNTAEDILRFDFPDASGMRETFEAALTDPERARWAALFLIKHEPNNRRLKTILAAHQMPDALRQSGDLKGCKALYLKIIGDTHEGDYSRLSTAKEFLTLATPAEKNRLRPVLLPLLSKDTASANSLDLLTDATLLRALHHPDCLPALLQILARPGSLYDSTNPVTVMAVRELGPEAQRKAVMQLINSIKLLPAPAADTDETFSDNADYFAKLAVLGSVADYDEAKRVMDNSHFHLWEQYQPLVGVSQQADAGQFLIHVLKNYLGMNAGIGDRCCRWLIFLLGDLRDPRAVPWLYRLLMKSVYSTEGYAAAEALGKIGGSENEKSALALLTSPDKDWARPQAVQILAQIQGPKILPLLRRMLREPDFGDKTRAIRLLAQYGTPDDLKALIPLADFWTGDRDLQRDATDAVAAIRDRYNYDIYGPIKVQ